MIALVVLAIASIGALNALIAAAKNVKDGQLQQYKAALTEARGRQLLLSDKSQLGSGSAGANQLYGSVGAYPGLTLDKIAIGTSPWQLDPNPPNPASPLATGALFTVSGIGVLTPLPTGAVASCADAAIPAGTLCREVAYLASMPNGTASTTGTANTLCTRVSRKGDPLLAYAVFGCEVIIK